jgi:peptide-methionine (S)-S-oxide reductase
MSNAEMLDSRFREAVAAVDAGDVTTVERLTRDHPELVRERLKKPGAWLRDKVGNALKGFFKEPYLLWFIAEDPVRNDTLPSNIANVARTIIDAAKRANVASLQEQLDYALSLIGWSWVAHRCGVQLQLIDVLVDAGAATAGVPDSALVNGHVAAAERLLERGAPLTLATAVCVGRLDDIPRLAASTSTRDKQMSLVLGSLNGRADGLVRLLQVGGIDVNTPSKDLYSHATPLHHAVCSGSLDAVKVLVNAGAKLTASDTVYHGTPLGWAEHYESEQQDAAAKHRYAEIAAYLRAKGA